MKNYPLSGQGSPLLVNTGSVFDLTLNLTTPELQAHNAGPVNSIGKRSGVPWAYLFN